MWEEEEKDMEKFKGKALGICQEFLAGQWKEVRLQDFHLSRISGGFSNSLYLCSATRKFKENEGEIPSEVLLRVYGPFKDQESDGYVEHVLQDTVIYTVLAEKGLGPKLYGVFANGRLEEFVPSSTLNSDNMRSFSRSIAEEMAKIHALQVPIKKDPDILVQSTEKWLYQIERNLKGLERDLSCDVFELLEKGAFRQDLAWLRNLMEETRSPVVFCHNDLVPENILLRQHREDEQDREDLILIDFEFACYNYRAFDIANHFCEWAFVYNTEKEPYFQYIPEKYPSEDEQSLFAEAYLKTMKSKGLFANTSLDEEKRKILEEVQVFQMFPHFFWTVSSLKRALNPASKFASAYVAYAEYRFRIYKNLKKEWLKKTCINDA